MDCVRYIYLDNLGTSCSEYIAVHLIIPKYLSTISVPYYTDKPRLWTLQTCYKAVIRLVNTRKRIKPTFILCQIESRLFFPDTQTLCHKERNLNYEAFFSHISGFYFHSSSKVTSKQNEIDTYFLERFLVHFPKRTSAIFHLK